NDHNQGDDAQNSPHGCISLGSSQPLPVLPRGTESFRPVGRFPILRSAAPGIKREQDAGEKKCQNRRAFPSLRSPAPSFAEGSRNLPRPGDSERIGGKPSWHSQNRTT